MTTGASKDDSRILLAMESAGRALRDRSGGGLLFLEERSDARLVLGSGAERDLTVTRARGAAVGGRLSVHVSDPELEQLAAIARGESIDPAGAVGAFTGNPPTPGWEFDPGWIRSLESSMTTQAERATRGISGAVWSATVIAFHQHVWVADDAGELHVDRRRGCRADVRVWNGWHPKRSAVEECVVDWESPVIPAGTIERAVERADRKRTLLGIPERGVACAVFAPGVGGVVVHELVGHALEGDVNVGRRSWILRDSLPRPRRELRVVDDPRRGRGAWRIDDEGIPSDEVVLIDAGRPAGLLLDRGTAAALGRASTGHGRRSSYLTAVRPRMGCTYVAPGEDDPREIMRETRAGVFIRRMTAGHTDPTAGRASFVVTEADTIMGGELGAPLEPFVIELTGHEAWGSIDRIGNDLSFDTCVGSCVRDGQPLAVSVGAPTIRIGVIRVVS